MVRMSAWICWSWWGCEEHAFNKVARVCLVSGNGRESFWGHSASIITNVEKMGSPDITSKTTSQYDGKRSGLEHLMLLCQSSQLALFGNERALWSISSEKSVEAYSTDMRVRPKFSFKLQKR